MSLVFVIYCLLLIYASQKHANVPNHPGYFFTGITKYMRLVLDIQYILEMVVILIIGYYNLMEMIIEIYGWFGDSAKHLYK